MDAVDVVRRSITIFRDEVTAEKKTGNGEVV